jgi:uncharacterized membrane protein YhaH (DUF805 family)
MSFGAAVRTVFSKYATFSGRARRSEYWWFYLFSILAYIVAAIIARAINTQIISLIVVLALIVPSLAVTARRLHDTDRSAWWMLISLVPLVGGIILIVFNCQDSSAGMNRFGASPKEAGPNPIGPGYPVTG